MEVYKSENIRNIVLLGHGSSGKTSLVEAMANLTGVTSRLGKVTDGNTISDFDKEEIKRKFSISTSIIPIEFEKTKINVLDTPGFFDFVGEAEEAAAAADAAVIVINGKAGVQVGTKRAWELCDRYNLPRMIYITGMDQNDVDYKGLVDELKGLYGNKIMPMSLPIRSDNGLKGYVSVIRNQAFNFDASGNIKETEIPAELDAVATEFRDALFESVAESSEEFMEKYFAGEEFTPEEINSAVEINVADVSFVPVTCGAPTSLIGVTNCMKAIVDYFPSPAQCKKTGTDEKGEFNADYDITKDKSAYVFKTIVDPFLGKYSLIKVCSGIIKNDDTLYNVQQEKEEKLSKLYILRGSKPIEVPALNAGDIGAIAKLEAKTGDSLATKAHPISYEPAKLSKPYTSKAYKAVNKGEVDKIAQGLARLNQEDNTFKIVNDSANRQSLIYGIGDQHIDVIVSKLQERYKVAVELDTPKVAFKETIRKKSDVDSKYKKQSGGHGQYGHVKMRFEPSGDMDKAFIFEEEVVGGSVPKNYFPAVEKGLADSVLAGPLAGYPVVGVKAVLYDGSYHPVDSSEMAFKTATSMAFKDGFMKAGPVLLEPIVTMKVTVPNDYTGDVMGDLNKRRGRVLGMDPVPGGKTCIVAEVPELETAGYATQLRSMTGGAGDFEYEFCRYEQAPSDVQEKEIAARAAMKDSEE